MPNLTFNTDEETLKKARKRAVERGVSLGTVVRGYLRRLAAKEDLNRAATDACL